LERKCTHSPSEIHWLVDDPPPRRGRDGLMRTPLRPSGNSPYLIPVLI
jgi:hypothetical protein